MAPKSETPMTYRELQAQAKSLGLPAKGKRAALEARIAAAGSNGSADANESEPALKYDGGIRLWPNGLAGIDQDGLFGVVPGYVNRKLAPGNSSILEELGAAMTFRSIATLAHFIWSPNAIWFAMAAALHYFAPYDLTLENPFSLAWMLPRFALNFAVAFAYYGFFFAALYIFKCGATRKYRPGSFPTVGNMAHNLWYWSLGIVQWTFWEAVMVKLWKRTDGGGVAMKTDAEVMSSNKLIAINLFWIIFIPVWRDAHFYIAHRFLHIRSIYTYVHKLHHRNADPEPFSGICMHPVEHMYYYACAFIPSLYLSSLSPLIFTWNFIHLTIAPGAGHSGFEDHFQADNYHFIHHAKFECNYGSPMSGFVDQALGTFRESLTKSRVYTGEWSEKNDDNAAALKALKGSATAKKNVWSVNGYLGLPASWDHAVYTIFWAALFPLAYCAVAPIGLAALGLDHLKSPLKSLSVPELIVMVVAYSPPLVAMALSKLSGDKMSWRWPFQKDAIVGSFGFFVFAGWLVCVLPIYHALKWLL